MNCLCESLGIALPGNGTYRRSRRPHQLAKHAGMAIMELVKKTLKPAIL